MERTIAVLGDVKDLSEILQGASLDQVRLRPGGTHLQLDAELTRACPEMAAAGRRGMGFGSRAPWVKSRLTLSEIRDASVQRLEADAPAQLSLLACDAVAGGYTLSITSHDGLKLVLTLEQLRGQFCDVGKPIVQH